MDADYNSVIQNSTEADEFAAATTSAIATNLGLQQGAFINASVRPGSIVYSATLASASAVNAVRLLVTSSSLSVAFKGTTIAANPSSFSSQAVASPTTTTATPTEESRRW